MLRVWSVRREDFFMPRILRLVMHHIQVFHTVFDLNPENHCAVAHDTLCADKGFFVFRGPGLPFPCREKAEGCSCNGAQQRDCPYIEVRSTISPLLAPSFFLSRPLRQVAATNDNLLVVHLPEDLLTLISGHRRGGRQLHTIELRPPIPLLHSSLLIFPLPLPRSAPLRPAQDIPVLFEFSSATTVTSLWRSVLPKLQANYGSVREASKFSQPPGAKPESQTLLSSENLKISHQAGQRTSKEDKSPEHCLLGTAMWMLSSSEPRSIPFSETYMMSVWACIAPLFVMSFVTLRQ